MDSILPASEVQDDVVVSDLSLTVQPIRNVYNDQTNEGSPEPLNDISMGSMIGYSIGHFYNDLCASMWFTYLMLYLEKVLLFKSALAGAVLLIGQVADAISTPLVGIASDNSYLAPCCLRRGRRLSWHIIGTICVTISFPFIFSKCFICEYFSWDDLSVGWYVPFVVIFQFGWAAVQISHLALIPEMSHNNSYRTTMNSLRYGFTVLANLFVFVLLTYFLNASDNGSGIEPSDAVHFQTMALINVGFGLLISIIFHLTTREPTPRAIRSRANSTVSNTSQYVRMSWMNWMRHPQFYQICLLYTLTRLFVNISQVYFPFYVILTKAFTKKYVAILPMISYVSSFIASIFMSIPVINRHINRKMSFLFGCILAIANCSAIHFDFGDYAVYIIGSILGIAQTVLLVTSLSITAELINKNTESGAFVYGAMSFGDKLANGIVVQIIELFNPLCKGVGSPTCATFYKNVMAFVPGGCAVLAIAVLITVLPQTIGARNHHTDHGVDQNTDEEDLLSNIQTMEE